MTKIASPITLTFIQGHISACVCVCVSTVLCVRVSVCNSSQVLLLYPVFVQRPPIIPPVCLCTQSASERNAALTERSSPHLSPHCSPASSPAQLPATVHARTRMITYARETNPVVHVRVQWINYGNTKRYQHALCWQEDKCTSVQ